MGGEGVMVRVVPLISIVTVCRNSATTIEETLNSIDDQTFRDFEHIVVDGQSSDATLTILERHRGGCRRIVSEADCGIYDAMNKGLAMAQGKWVHFLNADDRYASVNALMEMVDAVAGCEAEIQYGDMYQVFPNGTRHLYSWSGSQWMLFVSAKIPQPTTLYQRNALLRLNGFSDHWDVAGDHEILLRGVRAGLRICHHSVVLTEMHIGGVSSRNWQHSLREFAEVAHLHGQSRFVAWLLYRVKLLWSRLRR
jgi:glycosyltransferase involved in cell wall biosynthesis